MFGRLMMAIFAFVVGFWVSFALLPLLQGTIKDYWLHFAILIGLLLFFGLWVFDLKAERLNALASRKEHADQLAGLVLRAIVGALNIAKDQELDRMTWTLYVNGVGGFTYIPDIENRKEQLRTIAVGLGLTDVQVLVNYPQKRVDITANY